MMLRSSFRSSRRVVSLTSGPGSAIVRKWPDMPDAPTQDVLCLSGLIQSFKRTYYFKA